MRSPVGRVIPRGWELVVCSAYAYWLEELVFRLPARVLTAAVAFFTRPAVPPCFAGWPAVLAGVVVLAPLGRPLLASAKFWDNGPDESSG
jgi:hypothetical protein